MGKLLQLFPWCFTGFWLPDTARDYQNFSIDGGGMAGAVDYILASLYFQYKLKTRFMVKRRKLKTLMKYVPQIYAQLDFQENPTRL